MMEHSDQLDQLATALASAQAEFTAIPKGSQNPFFKSAYAALPDVVQAASPIVTKHGLSIAQFMGTDSEGRDTLTTYLLHKSGQYIAQTMRLHLTKDDPQGQGSATTYARRYSYMSVLGLVADEDDDGNAAGKGRQYHDNRPKAVTDQPSRNVVAENAKYMNLKGADLAAPSESQLNEIARLAKKKGTSTELITRGLLLIETSRQAEDKIAELKKEVGE